MTRNNFCDIIIKMRDPLVNRASINPATLENGLTQSELGMMNECALKWNFRYNNLLERADQFQWQLFVGTSWHNFQEMWRKDSNCDVTKFVPPIIPPNIVRTSDFEADLEYWSQVLPAFQQNYTEHYKEEKGMEWMLIEEELSAELLGFILRGKIDLAHEQFRFIRDFKSTVSAWLISGDGWDFKLQFMMYCWLMVNPNNYPSWGKKKFTFQMDVLQKPALRQTKADGTWAGHIRRVVADIKSRPEFYFTRQSADIFPEQIKRFEDNVLVPKLQKIALIRDNPAETECLINDMNTNACNMFGNRCEFWDICEKGWDVAKFFYTNREVKHQEL